MGSTSAKRKSIDPFQRVGGAQAGEDAEYGEESSQNMEDYPILTGGQQYFSIE